jgi:hypothetical protein
MGSVVGVIARQPQFDQNLAEADDGLVVRQVLHPRAGRLRAQIDAAVQQPSAGELQGRVQAQPVDHASSPSAAPPGRARTASCGSARCLPAAAGCAAADSRTAAAQAPAPSAAPARQHRPVAVTHSGRSSGRARPDRRHAAASSTSLGSPRPRSASLSWASELSQRFLQRVIVVTKKGAA